MKKIFYGLVVCIMAVVTVLPNVSAATYESKNWDALVKAMKSEEIISSFKNEFEDEIDVTVTSDANNINYLIKDVTTNKEYNVKITQNNGIARFVTTVDANNIDVDLAEYESGVVIYFLFATISQYGYEYEEFAEWLSNVDGTKINVNDDGLELETYEFVITELDEDGNEVEVTYECLKSLAINIDCGISAFTNYVPEDTTEPEVDPEPETKPETKPEVDPEPETKPEQKPEVDPEPETKPEQKPEVDPEPETKPEVKPEEDKETTVENPPTSLYTSFGIIGVAVAGLIGFMVSRKKSYFSKI